MILGSPSSPKVVPKRFLVTQKRYFGKAETRKTRIRALKRKGIELLWFEDIIDDLLNYLDKDTGSGKLDPLVLKTMRELRVITSDEG